MPSALTKLALEIFHLSTSEVIAKRWPSPDTKSAGTVPMAFPGLEFWGINFCCFISHPESMVFCHSSPNGPRQPSGRGWTRRNKTHSLAFQYLEGPKNHSSWAAWRWSQTDRAPRPCKSRQKSSLEECTIILGLNLFLYINFKYSTGTHRIQHTRKPKTLENRLKQMTKQT